MSGRQSIPWIGLLALAVVGALIGFGAGRMTASRPLGQETGGIEGNYVAAARNLDSPRPLEPPIATSAPAYPHLLASLGDLTKGTGGARRLQWILLGALTPLLAGFAAARQFGAAAGMASGVLVLLMGGFWVTAGMAVPFVWQALAALGVVALAPPLGRDKSGPLLPAALAMGLLIAAARVFGAAWAPAFAVVLVLLMLSRREYTAGIGLAMVFALSLALLGALKLDRTPAAQPLIGGGGVEAVLGWHDGATGVDPRRGEPAPWRWITLREIALEAEAESGQFASVTGLSRMSYGRAAGWIVTHPVASATLFVRKAWLVLSGAELAAPESLAFRARQSLPWAAWLFPVSILVMALGVTGVAAAAGRRRPVPSIDGLTVIKALLLATVLASAATVVRTGDRLALLLAMTGAAGWAITSFRTLPRAALALGALALAAGIGAWYVDGRRIESPAEDHYLMGTVYDRLKRSAEAGAEYDRAVNADPRHVGARLARAGRLATDGLYDGAISEAEAIVAANPRMVTVWGMLARLYQTQKRLPEAQSAYERVVELTPRDPEAWNNLGTIHAALGHYQPSIDALKKALAIDPNYRSAFVNLTELEKRGPEGLAAATPQLTEPNAVGVGLTEGVGEVIQRIQANDVAGAEAQLAQLRERFGASPEIDLAAGTLALHVGRLDDAVNLLTRAKSSPTLASAALYNLGVAETRRGDAAAARAAFTEVLRLDPANQPARAALDALNAGGPPP